MRNTNNRYNKCQVDDALCQAFNAIVQFYMQTTYLGEPIVDIIPTTIKFIYMGSFFAVI